MKKLLLLFLLATSSFGMTEPDRAFVSERNLLRNPGFENGTQGWTASTVGTFTTQTGAASIAAGNMSVLWSPGAIGQQVDSSTISITSGGGVASRAGVAECLFKTSLASMKMNVINSSGTKLNEETASLVGATSGNFSRSSVYFTFPSSGGVRLRFTTGAAGTVSIDDCFVGPVDFYPAFNMQAFSNPTVCNTDPCNIASLTKTSDWVSSITRVSQGVYTLNIRSGVFSSSPVCFGTVMNNDLDVIVMRTAGITATTYGFSTSTTAGVAEDMNFNIMCYGPR